MLTKEGGLNINKFTLAVFFFRRNADSDWAVKEGTNNFRKCNLD